MVLNTKEFQTACKKILFAIDNKESTLINETLELVANGNYLELNVTNREYYCTVVFQLPTEETFKATVNASLFLNLISKLTTSTIEITKNGTALDIKANGEYKLPMVYNNDELLDLPKISINNITNEMEINSNVLHSIATYNSKELLRGVIAKPVQKYYYVDENGAITFTSGACVNSFTLEKPVKLLLSDKVVKLFKLFADDSKVHFSMGQDAVTEELIQTKVQFKTSNVTITAKLSDSSLVTSVPVTAIRSMAEKVYNYSVVVNRANLLQAIQRITLFNDDLPYGDLEFSNSNLVIYNCRKDNKETITLNNNCEALVSYTMTLDLNNLKSIVDDTEDEFITICFGDNKAVTIKKNNICDITPERKLK